MFGTNIEFGATTLIGCDECGRTCGNGLPVTPAPTRMLSRFTQLAALDHPNLCKYVELVRCQAAVNAVTLVSEHLTNSVWSALAKSDKRSDSGFMTKVAQQTAEAIAYCHRNRIVIGYLTPDSILLAEEKDPRIKLCQYGLYHVSGNNADVEYVLGSPWHQAPERIAQLPNRCPATFKSDIWALGMILLELATGIRLSEVWRVRQILSVLSSVIRKANNGSVLTPLLDAIRIARPEELTVPAQLAPVIERCLQVLPSQRPSADELVQLLESNAKSGDNMIAEANGIDESIEAIKARIKATGVRNECFNRPLRELFFLWKLCGSTVENILIKRGIIRMRPPVRTVPSLAVGDFQMLGNEEGRKFNTTFDVCILPSSNLKERLSSIATEVLCHSFELERILGHTRTPALDDQTVIVKERDIDYQVTRMRILSKLLLAYPYKPALLREECLKDIPPSYRGETWAALLDVTERTAQEQFLRLDITTEQASDRQLQVDIPRCHQYDELMTSPAAHYKLKHLLKTWLASEADHYVYWQGLDSLAAPFLVLHFNNLPVAFASLKAFIARYLHNFFLKDNSPIIQEYLAVFMQVLAFADSELFSHLHALDFRPELFAIPWFLTCFAHVLPLHKLFHLWDTLLLTDSSFPLFIGVAILLQLRPQLIQAQFNDAILLFSDLPDLSIDNVVATSLKLYRSIPASCTSRQHASPHLRKEFHPTQTLTYFELLDYYCPRIAVEDLQKLVEQKQVLVVDLRSQMEHSRNGPPGSVSCPHASSGSFDVVLQAIGTALETARRNEHVICFADSSDHYSTVAREVANACVANGFDRVCVLDGGVNSMLRF